MKHPERKQLSQLALMELPNLIDEDRLRIWFLEVLHQSKITCCHCGHPVGERSRQTYLKYRITSCSNCGKKIQFFRGTIFQYARISPEQFVLIAAFLELGISTKNIATALGLSYSSVSGWAEKINRGDVKL